MSFKFKLSELYPVKAIYRMSLRKIGFTLFFGFAFLINFGFASDSLARRMNVLIVPSIYYTPDTRWGFGGAGALSFYWKKDRVRKYKSNFSFGVSYTQNKQVLSYIPYQFYFEQNKYWLLGELGYYRYVFNYYGIQSPPQNDYLEKYSANLIRIRINASKKIRDGLYLGLKYSADDFRFTKKDTSSLLFSQYIIGNKNGNTSGIGLIFLMDHRNQVNYPSKGFIAESGFTVDQPLWGSDFHFVKFNLDFARYMKLYKSLIMAAGFSLQMSSNGVPFHQMSTLGGSRRLRGYYDGRFRDQHGILSQIEFRVPLFYRFKLALFGGVGTTWSRHSRWDELYTIYNYGLGLRILFDKDAQQHLRLDYGWGIQSKGFYLTVSEAF